MRQYSIRSIHGIPFRSLVLHFDKDPIRPTIKFTVPFQRNLVQEEIWSTHGLDGELKGIMTISKPRENGMDG